MGADNPRSFGELKEPKSYPAFFVRRGETRA